MNEHQRLKRKGRKVSTMLLQSKYLLEVLYELVCDDAKMMTVIDILQQNNKKSFYGVEKCLEILRYKQFK
ncbi:hypothetical protein IKQ26_05475 [bacterium]|nr:hypothetical protein [bacterium]